MKIGIIGYGKMGKMVESRLHTFGHTVAWIADPAQMDLEEALQIPADAAIEFTAPHAAPHNLKLCFKHGVPVASGSTGWLDNLDEVKSELDKFNGTLLYASNFSLGVNLLFALNKKLAQWTAQYPDIYTPHISETHHTHKLDSPSGTGLSLAGHILSEWESLATWELTDPKIIDKISLKGVLPIASIREGEVIGDHTVNYISEEDRITIEHSAFNRQGFADGAIRAAEFIADKKGLFTIEDLYPFN